MNFRRFKQVWHYAKKDSIKIKEQNGKGYLYRLNIFLDMIYSYLKYNMWTNQYVKEEFYNKSSEEKEKIGFEYKKKGYKRDKWQKEFIEDRKFFLKYSQKKYELPHLRQKRTNAYRQKYNMGSDCLVEYDVELSRQHYLPGTIKIGNNVLLAKHVFIDYSGVVEIKDDVQLTNGVIIETHHHSFHSKYFETRNKIIPSNLIIEKGAVIGSMAIILASCNYIGKHARIGAGAVVTKDIPDYATAVGVPAKVVRINNIIEEQITCV